MNSCLIHLPYFPNIATMVAIFNFDSIALEYWDNYTKQTYRNRTKILGPNGVLNLTIPVIHSQKERNLYRAVRIKNEENWQLNHWKSIKTAYNSSPFFEFYQDELLPLFTSNFEYLFDFNQNCLTTVLDLLDIELKLGQTTKFNSEYSTGDFRSLIIAKNEPEFQFEPYTQVFEDRFSFKPNLSILDLLFNEGPNTVNYLKRQHLRV